jgi:hypothetical protein
MHREFNIAERGAGSYWPLTILRWVMVLIFISFGIQKFTPQSAQGIALYISNSPFVSWLHIFGIRGEAYLLGCIGRAYITLDDQTALEAAQSDPAGFIRGLDKAIIDEIQRARPAAGDQEDGR